ncbi:hypothetical protein HA397_27085, partial [Escherichia coli]|nr:hypothetical protein [Escherichia coli]
MAQTIETAYPNLLLNLDEDLDPQIDAILDAYFNNKASSASSEATERDLILRTGLRQAIDAYASGALERTWQRSETEENEFLDRVSQKIQSVRDILLRFTDYPGLEPRVERQIREFGHHYEFRNGVSLPQLVGTRRGIFREFREMLLDV